MLRSLPCHYDVLLNADRGQLKITSDVEPVHDIHWLDSMVELAEMLVVNSHLHLIQKQSYKLTNC